MNSNQATPRAAERLVQWIVPQGWESVESNQPMRVATFAASGAEVTVTAFPGSVGGTLANINRWRGQIGLEPASDADLSALLKTSREGTSEVSVLSMIGSAGQVMLAAIIVPGDGQTWFVKCVAQPAKANDVRPAFELFAKSFRMNPQSQGPELTPSEVNPGPNSHAVSSAIEARFASWVAPSNWTPEALAGGVLAAAFVATNSKGGARATASSLVNDGGGPLANINRWREQLSLAPVADVADQPLGTVGPGSALVDLTNAAGTDRLISVIVQSDQVTWFFKLRGPPAGVESERTAFEGFVRAVGLGAGQ